MQKEKAELDLLLAHHSNGLGVFQKEELLEMYLKIIERSKDQEKLIEGIIADNEQHQAYFLSNLVSKKDSSYQDFQNALQEAIDRKNNNKPVYYYNANLDLVDRRTVGMKLYRTFCAVCHGIDGEGIENLAPRLIDSEYVSGETDQLILITLHGMSGPIQLDGKEYNFSGEMAGLNENDELTDKDIKDILHFVRNAFTSAPYSIEESQIKKLREVKPKGGGSYTQASLDSVLLELKKENN